MSKSPPSEPRLRQDNDRPPPQQSAPAEPTPSQTPQQNFTKPFSFPFRYLLRDPPDPISSLKENSLESPLQSPVLRSENRESCFLASPLRSSPKGEDNTPAAAAASLQPLSTQNDSASKSPERDLTEVFTNCESPMLQMNRSPENPVVANRLAASPTTAAKIGRGGVNGKRVESGVVRRVGTKKAELGLRVLEVIFCMISFSVMAADKTTGWAGDSFDRYQEFRYCVSINVIGFVYSVFQVYAQFHYRIKRRRIVDRPLSYYLDFSMDQALAYLLMSASSSAAARNDDWISMFGNDKFTDMMKGSIAMSFLAFFAFALSSIISADKLFSWNL